MAPTGPAGQAGRQTGDPVVEWTVTFERVCALVGSLTAEQLGVHVPACPDWTTRDLVSHMVGLGADVVGGDEPDDHDDDWTQAQVDARRGRSASDLVAEWQGVADPLVDWMRDHGSRPLNDVVIHEQDLRGAVGIVGGRDTAALAIVRDRMAQKLGDRLAQRLASRVEDLPPLALVGPSWQWCSSGEPADAPVALEADDFDLFRGLVSRRTAQQLRGWTVRGDLTPYLDAFAGLGPLPPEPLPE